MAINLSDNIYTSAPKPTDSRYLNNLVPYSSVSAANTAIVSGIRYTGLTVNILGAEYWYCNGIADGNLVIKSSGGGSSASGERITKLINITSHGFNINDVLGWSGGTYNKALASTTYDGEILGIVSKCYNANCFDLTQAGYVTGLTSLSINTTYFLSKTTAGLLTSTAPSLAGDIVKPVIIADSSTSGWVLPYAGFQLAVNSGSTSAAIAEFTITGNSSATGFTINHAKNKQFVAVEIVKNSSPYPTVYTNVQRTNANCVCVTFDTPPATGQQYKILIIS
jgi:hypothetical protein